MVVASRRRFVIPCGLRLETHPVAARPGGGERADPRCGHVAGLPLLSPEPGSGLLRLLRRAPLPAWLVRSSPPQCSLSHCSLPFLLQSLSQFLSTPVTILLQILLQFQSPRPLVQRCPGPGSMDELGLQSATWVVRHSIIMAVPQHVDFWRGVSVCIVCSVVVAQRYGDTGIQWYSGAVMQYSGAVRHRYTDLGVQ